MTSDLTLAELGRIVKLHPVTLRRLARRGELPGAYRLGRQWRLRRDALDGLRCAQEQVDAPAEGLAAAVGV